MNVSNQYNTKIFSQIMSYHYYSISKGVKRKPNESPLKDYILFVAGRLRRGRLHGRVVMKGVLTNDPKSPCGHEIQVRWFGL